MQVIDLGAWTPYLEQELRAPYFAALLQRVGAARAAGTVYPPEERTFFALTATPPERVRAVILGQDPYHDDGQAHGLAFSVRPGVKFPPSLRNIFRELNSDLGLPVPSSGSLEHWARQGVLLLNTVLTVRAHSAGSHQKHGWEEFTDAVIRTVNGFSSPVVFVLWGAPAQKKLPLINIGRHTVLQSAHPSPLSAFRGFFGSKPFSAINRALELTGEPPIDFSGPQP